MFSPSVISVQCATCWSPGWRLCSVPSPGPRPAMFSPSVISVQCATCWSLVWRLCSVPIHVQPCSVHLWYLFSVPPAEVWCVGSVRSRSTSSHVQSICDMCSVCHLLKSGVAALFGPESGTTSSHVQSICDAMEIPHIETRWDYLVKRDDYSINLYPSPKQISRVIYRFTVLLFTDKPIVLFRTISTCSPRPFVLRHRFIEYSYCVCTTIGPSRSRIYYSNIWSCLVS